MRRWNVGFIAAILLPVAILAGGVLRPQLERSTTQAPANKFRLDASEATPVQEGVMTDRQKRHSKIFKGYQTYTSGKKLSDLARDKGDTTVIKPMGDMIVPRNLTLRDYLSKLACTSDLVVVGTVTDKSSQLIDDGSFVFTDYELSVESVLKDSKDGPIIGSTAITITRVGGAVKINGRLVSAVDFSQRPLFRGKRYLLFLSFLPDVGAFKNASKWGEDTFEFVGNEMAQVSERDVPLGTSRRVDAAGFMSELNHVLGAPCKP